MKAVILAGGFGTRISEESAVRPKPMVEIGGKPILWHIMKHYSAHGVHEFVICAGYRSYMIKEYFANYFLHTTDVTVDLRENRLEWHASTTEPWRVTIVDTGDGTMTGGRIRRVREFVGDETFFMTYGDCLSDLDLSRVLEAHESWGSLVTLTAIQPPGRFGAIVMSDGQHTIESFKEKPHGDGAWVNGGFFVVEPEALGYIAGDATVWEAEPLEQIASAGRLSAYQHDGFWHPMDTLRDKSVLEELWSSGEAPWKIW
jgi:glucose-1-phosphate cytidylyltransferase